MQVKNIFFLPFPHSMCLTLWQNKITCLLLMQNINWSWTCSNSQWPWNWDSMMYFFLYRVRRIAVWAPVTRISSPFSPPPPLPLSSSSFLLPLFLELLQRISTRGNPWSQKPEDHPNYVHWKTEAQTPELEIRLRVTDPEDWGSVNMKWLEIDWE